MRSRCNTQSPATTKLYIEAVLCTQCFVHRFLQSPLQGICENSSCQRISMPPPVRRRQILDAFCHFEAVQKGISASLGCFQKWWVFPQIIHFNSVFHDFHHPFWGTTIFGNTLRNHFSNITSYHISYSYPRASWQTQEALQDCDVLIHAVPVQSSRKVEWWRDWWLLATFCFMHLSADVFWIVLVISDHSW